MKKRFLLASILAGSLMTCSYTFALDTKNIDTPNLDFSQGEKGWTFQTGWYTTSLKGATSEYTYIWDRKSVGDSKPVAIMDITATNGNNPVELKEEEKARFWRPTNSWEKDEKFSYIPLYVMPAENRSGVMRIGRPEPWKGNSAVRYTLKGTMGGPNTEDSKGNRVNFPAVNYLVNKQHCYDAGCEFYGSHSNGWVGNDKAGLTATDWHNPYVNYTKKAHNPWAGAERMYYDFTVTNNSTLLIYRFLAILSSPQSSYNHSENGYPEMVVNVMVRNGNGWDTIPCANQHVTASEFNPELNYPGMQPMFHAIPFAQGPNTVLFDGSGIGEEQSRFLTENCNAPANHLASHNVGNATGSVNQTCFLNYATVLSDSQTKSYVSRYYNSGWRTRYADLRKYVGKTVRVEVLNHDCLMNNDPDGTHAIVAGGHSSYGYFQAETRRMDLVVPTCIRGYWEDETKVMVVAPDGFSTADGTYKWKLGKSAPEIEVDPLRPNVAYIPKDSLLDNETIYCTINMDTTDTRGCSTISLNAPLPRENSLEEKPDIRPDFRMDDLCGGFVRLTNTTKVLSQGTDIIDSCLWKISSPKGSYYSNSNETYFTFDYPNREYKITLTVFTWCGYSYTKDSVVYSPEFLSGNWLENVKVCEGDEFTMCPSTSFPGYTYSWYELDDPLGRLDTIRPISNEPCIRGVMKDEPRRYFGLVVTSSGWGGAPVCRYERTAFVASMKKPELKAVVDYPNPCPETEITLSVEKREPDCDYIWTREGFPQKWQSKDGIRKTTVYEPDKDYTYVVQANNRNGCYRWDTITVHTVSAPVVSLDSISDICYGDTVYAHARTTPSSEDAYDYYWRINDRPEFLGESSHYFNSSEARVGTNTISVRAGKDGCMSAADSATFVRRSPFSVAIEGRAEVDYRDTVEMGDTLHFHSYVFCEDHCKPYSSIWEDADCGKYGDAFCPKDEYSYTWRLNGGPSQTGKDFTLVALNSGVNRVGLWVSNGLCSQYTERVFFVKEKTVVQVDIEGNDKVCEGSSFLLVAHVSENGKRVEDTTYIYQWRRNGSPMGGGRELFIRDASLDDEGTYVVEVRDADNVILATDTHYVGVVALPDFHVLVQESPNVCLGDELHLWAEGDSSIVQYEWLTPMGRFEGSDLRYTPEMSKKQYSEIQSVTVTAVTIEGCQRKASLNYTISDRPVVTIEGKTSACEGEIIRLDAVVSTENTRVTWSTGDVGPSIEFTAFESTVIRAVVNSEGGCHTEVEFPITVNDSPVLSVMGMTEVCQGEEIRLAFSGAETYVFDGHVVPSDTVLPSNLEPGTHLYRLQGTNVSGCSSVVDISVVIHKLPEVHIDSLASTSFVSRGGMAVVTAASMDSVRVWYWRPVERVGKSVTMELDTTTTFVVTAYDENMCRSTAEHTVFVTEKASFTVEGPGNVCQGETVTLKAFCDKELEYTWRVLEGEKETVVATGAEYTFTPNKNTIVIVKGRSKSGDVETEEKVVNVQLNPYPDLFISQKPHACYGSSVALFVEGAEKYEWYDEKDSLLTISSDWEIPNVTSSATYTVVGTNEYGCSSKKDYYLDVRPLPSILIEGLPLSNQFCEGDWLPLHATIDTTKYYIPDTCCVMPYFDYYWSNGTEGPSCLLTFDTAGIQQYSVVCVDSYGCQSEETITFEVLKAPTISIEGVRPVCAGGSITLEASGDAEYWQWSTGDTSATTTLSNVVTDTVVRLYGQSNVCISTISAEIKTRPLPDLSISGETLICKGGTVTLIASGADVYEWSNGTITPHLEEGNVTEKKLYIVKGTDGWGCSSTRSVVVDVRELPTLSIVDPNFEKVCEGVSYVFGVDSEECDNFRCWDETGKFYDSLHVTFTNPGVHTYTVEGYDRYGCSNQTSKTMEVMKNPTIAIEGVHPICEGDSIMLTASGDADVWHWSVNSDSSTSVATLVKVESDTLVRLTGVTMDGCRSEVTAIVPVNPLPVLSLKEKPSVCKGGDLVLTAQGAETYQWEANEKPGAELYLTNLTEGGFYTLTGVSSEGCSMTTNVLVSVLPLPQVRILGPSEGCFGDTARLFGQGAVSYQWSDGSTLDYTDVVFDNTSTYRLIGWDENGCSNSAAIHLKAVEKPEITILGDTVVCKGDTLTIAAKTNFPSTTWRWSNGSVSPVFSTVPDSSSQIYVQATYGACTTQRPVHLVVNPLPVLGVEGRTDLCKGERLELHAVGAESYFWGDAKDNKTDSILVVEKPTATTYRLSGYNEFGCFSSITVPVNIFEWPKLAIEAPDSVCKGDTTRLLAQSPTCVSYLWGDSSSFSYRDVVMKKATTYKLTGIDDHGCKVTASKRIYLYPSPQVKLLGDTRVCQDSTVRLQAQGALSYVWSDGSLLDYCDVTVDAKRKYSVVGKNEYGCRATASLTITAVKNPVLTIKGDSSVCLGDTVKLRASTKQTDTQWQWGNGSTESLYTLLPSADTSVSIVATHDICSVEKKIAIKIKESPAISVEGATAICSGSTLNLKGVGAKKYYWNGKSVNPLKLALKSDSLFTLKGVAANGCSSEIQVPVTVEALPKVSIEGDSLTCSGSKNTLVAKTDRGVSYLWNNKSTDSIISPKVTAVRTYKVTVTDTLGLHCKATASFVVTPIATPKLVVSGDRSIICGGRDLTLTGSNLLDSAGTQTKYVWSIAGEEKGEGPVYTDFYAKKTTVRLTGTQGGCTSHKDTTLTVYANPKLTISGKKSICQHATLKLTPTAKSSATITGYAWTAGNDTLSDGVLTFPMDSVGTFFYALHVDDSRGCSTDSVVKVVVHSLPVLSIESQNLCADSLFTLTVKRTDEEKENETSYVWKKKNVKDTLSTIDQLSAVISTPTTYVVSAKDVYGCKASLSKKITPTTSVFKILGAKQVCSGMDALLTASNPSSSVSYTWYDKDPQVAEDATSIAEGAEYELSGVTQEKTLYLVGDNGRCKLYAKHTLTPVEKPKLHYSGNTEPCEGESAELLADGREDGILYAWDDQEPSDYATYTSEELALGETYTVKLTGSLGDCSSELLVPITVSPMPKATVLAKEVYSGEEFVLNYELEDNGAVILTEKWYSDLGLLGGKYAESMDGMIENHPWTTSFTTTKDDVFNMNLELLTDKGCAQSLPIEIPVKAKVVAGKYRAFNALGQIIGVFDLNDDTPLVDQLSFYRGFEILFLQSLDDDDVLLKVRVNKK